MRTQKRDCVEAHVRVQSLHTRFERMLGDALCERLCRAIGTAFPLHPTMTAPIREAPAPWFSPKVTEQIRRLRLLTRRSAVGPKKPLLATLDVVRTALTPRKPRLRRKPPKQQEMFT